VKVKNVCRGAGDRRIFQGHIVTFATKSLNLENLSYGGDSNRVPFRYK